jgi:hypothetical protein
MALILRCDICSLEEEMERNGNVTLYLTMTDGTQITNTGMAGLVVDLCKSCKLTSSGKIKDQMRKNILAELEEKPRQMFGGRNVVRGENDTV